MESNMSWSWLERWMATRLPETSSVESHAMKQYDPSNGSHKFTIMTRFFDAAGEEKESCGSNEVPLHFDNYSINSREEKFSFKPHTPKTNFKARRTVSRRKTVPSYQFHEEQPKVRTQNLFISSHAIQAKHNIFMIMSQWFYTSKQTTILASVVNLLY